MALNFEQAFNNSNARGASNGAQERPKTEIWLNVGFVVTAPNKEGEMEERFVNLPIGIPIDTMEKLPITGQNKDWNEFQTARNWLLEKLQKHGASMEPGAEEVVSGLVIKLKRTAKPAQVDADNISYLDMADIKFG